MYPYLPLVLQPFSLMSVPRNAKYWLNNSVAGSVDIALLLCAIYHRELSASSVATLIGHTRQNVSAVTGATGLPPPLPPIESTK